MAALGLYSCTSSFSLPVAKKTQRIQSFSYTLHQSPTRRLNTNLKRQTLCSACANSSELNIRSTSSHNIWLSNVFVQRKSDKRLLRRKWTGQDATYLSFMVLVHGLSLFAPFTFNWGAFGAFVCLYIITGLFGITLSFHRNLSHKSFHVPKWLEYTFAYCGVQAMQGDPIAWVSSHRYHHQHCDTDKDPHTPQHGFWHSHLGWLLDSISFIDKVGDAINAKDISEDSFYKFIAKTYPFHGLGMTVLLYALGGVPYVIWGMAVRIVWVYHITWAVNSAAHVWGSQQWRTGDLSRNNWWVALLAFGEGWHNNHHAFEFSARHGLEWWQFDITWYIVKLLQALGLATKVRLPSQEQKLKLAL